MANGSYSPLQLTAGYGLLQNQGLNIPTAYAANISAYTSIPMIANLLSTISLAESLGGTANVTPATLLQLQTLGASNCPALGDSIPAAYANTAYPTPPTPVSYLIPETYPSQFTGYLQNQVTVMLGNGDYSKFSQLYFSSQGFVAMNNDIINSVVNANSNNYLGPTYNQAASGIGNMVNLITGDIAKINLAFEPFGNDLFNLGNLLDLADLENIGSPGALLQQLSAEGNMINGTLPAIQDELLKQGLSLQDIKDLVNGNVVSYWNPDGLSMNAYNKLQQRAYPALLNITGDNLADVLSILGVTTPNIDTMADLLNPVKLFPTSYPSMTLPAPQGPVLIYDQQGNVNDIVIPLVYENSLGPSGCDELAKIVPQNQAVGSKAIGLGMLQIKNVNTLTLRDLAVAVAA